MSVLSCIIVFVFMTPCFFSGNNAYIPRFLNGRPRGGMLGIPRTSGNKTLLSNQLVSETKWFIQPLNHFDQSNPSIWKQKYFVNAMHYKTGGPIFVQIGGEGKANSIWMYEGAWTDYARTYNAYMIMVEHRYYGDSHPTPDMSTSNLKYLSSEQALADLSLIIEYYREKMPTSKVVVFGGSYSGALAAWFRMKYPHLADGAIANSAPVLAKVDFKEYMEEVDKTLNLFDDINCAGNVNFASALVTHLLKTQMGRNLLKKEFRLCSDIDNTNAKDVDTLFSNLANNFLGVIQYNKDNRAFEGAKGTSITIDKLCKMMDNSDLGSQLERYAAINTMMLDVNNEKCLEFRYSEMIKDLRGVYWNSSAAEGGRQWTYQTCTEFAYFQASEGWQQPFGNYFPVEYFIQQCVDIFGSDFTLGEIDAAVKATNTHYGGRNLKVTNVLFPNGSVDPWHALSILKDLNSAAKAIFMNGTAHCANMYPPLTTDLPVLKQARVEISKTIGQWIA